MNITFEPPKYQNPAPSGGLHPVSDLAEHHNPALPEAQAHQNPAYRPVHLTIRELVSMQSRCERCLWLHQRYPELTKITDYQISMLMGTAFDETIKRNFTHLDYLELFKYETGTFFGYEKGFVNRGLTDVAMQLWDNEHKIKYVIKGKADKIFVHPHKRLVDVFEIKWGGRTTPLSAYSEAQVSLYAMALKHPIQGIPLEPRIVAVLGATMAGISYLQERYGEMGVEFEAQQVIYSENKVFKLINRFSELYLRENPPNPGERCVKCKDTSLRVQIERSW